MILWTAVLLASGLREGVLNLRPVSPSLPGLYRSAAYERETAADAAEILDGLRIRTVIDLRNTAPRLRGAEARWRTHRSPFTVTDLRLR